MDTRQDLVQDPQLRKLEAALAERMSMLFRRCPVLCGFSVQDGSRLSRERAAGPLTGSLFLADLTCHRLISEEQAAELCEVIADALLDLMDERPESAELMTGRTFARSVH
jgi:hypothetical protein